jgi:hypothetical protein
LFTGIPPERAGNSSPPSPLTPSSSAILRLSVTLVSGFAIVMCVCVGAARCAFLLTPPSQTPDRKNTCRTQQLNRQPSAAHESSSATEEILWIINALRIQSSVISSLPSLPLGVSSCSAARLRHFATRLLNVQSLLLSLDCRCALTISPEANLHSLAINAAVQKH